MMAPSMVARAPSPFGRGSRRRRGVRGYAAGDYAFANADHGKWLTSKPLTRSLRDHPLPLGEGAARLSLFRIEPRERIARRPRPRDVQRALDFRHDPIQSLLDFCIGEAQFDISVRLDAGASQRIIFDLLRVLPAVEFDGDRGIDAAEIHDISRDWNLPAEFESAKSSSAQDSPKNILGRGLRLAQSARELNGALDHGAHYFAAPTLVQREGRRVGISKPLARPLRGHPLPLGEGLARLREQR